MYVHAPISSGIYKLTYKLLSPGKLIELLRRTYAHCKNATRETGIWKLDTELYQGVRNTFNQHLTMQEEWGYDDFDEDEPL